MFTRDNLLAELVDRFARLDGLYQLFTSVGILTSYQPFVLFARHFTFEFPLIGETATPATLNLTGFAVVVVFRVGELLLVVVQRLPCGYCCSSSSWSTASETRVERVSILGSDFELIDLLVIVLFGRHMRW